MTDQPTPADTTEQVLFLVAQDPDTDRWQVARTHRHNANHSQQILTDDNTETVSTHRSKAMAIIAARRAARSRPEGAHLLTPEEPGHSEVLFDKRLRSRWGWLLAVVAVIPLAWASSPEAWRDGIVPAAFGGVLMTVAAVGVIQTALTARRHPDEDTTPPLSYIIIRLIALGVAAAATSAAALAAGEYQTGAAGFMSRLPAVAMAAFSLMLATSLMMGLVTYATTGPNHPNTDNGPDPDDSNVNVDDSGVDDSDDSTGSELNKGDDQP